MGLGSFGRHVVCEERFLPCGSVTRVKILPPLVNSVHLVSTCFQGKCAFSPSRAVLAFVQNVKFRWSFHVFSRLIFFIKSRGLFSRRRKNSQLAIKCSVPIDPGETVGR